MYDLTIIIVGGTFLRQRWKFRSLRVSSSHKMGTSVHVTFYLLSELGPERLRFRHGRDMAVNGGKDSYRNETRLV